MNGDETIGNPQSSSTPSNPTSRPLPDTGQSRGVTHRRGSRSLGGRNILRMDNPPPPLEDDEQPADTSLVSDEDVEKRFVAMSVSQIAEYYMKNVDDDDKEAAGTNPPGEVVSAFVKGYLRKEMQQERKTSQEQRQTQIQQQQNQQDGREDSSVNEDSVNGNPELEAELDKAGITPQVVENIKNMGTSLRGDCYIKGLELLEKKYPRSTAQSYKEAIIALGWKFIKAQRQANSMKAQLMSNLRSSRRVTPEDPLVSILKTFTAPIERRRRNPSSDLDEGLDPPVIRIPRKSNTKRKSLAQLSKECCAKEKQSDSSSDSESSKETPLRKTTIPVQGPHIPPLTPSFPINFLSQMPRHIKPFDGLPGSDAVQFLRNFEKMAGSWDEVTKISQFSQYLEDAASDWLDTLEKQLKTASDYDKRGKLTNRWVTITWPKLRKLFVREYTEDQEKIFQDLQQSPRESGTSFLYKAINTHAGSTLGYTHKKLIKTIIRKMTPSYLKEFRGQRFQDLSEFKLAVKEYDQERLEGDRHDKVDKRSARVAAMHKCASSSDSDSEEERQTLATKTAKKKKLVPQPSSTTSPTKPDSVNLVQEFKDLTKEMIAVVRGSTPISDPLNPKPNTSPNPPSYLCYSCGSPQHFANQCPQRIQTRSQPVPPVRSPFRPNGGRGSYFRGRGGQFQQRFQSPSRGGWRGRWNSNYTHANYRDNYQRRDSPRQPALLPKAEPAHNQQCKRSISYSILNIGKGRQIYVALNLNGKSIPALIDTGSGVTIMEPSLVQNELVTAPTKMRNIVTANGDSIHILGEHKGRLSWGKLITEWNITVAKGLPKGMIILGNDFLTNFDLTLNYTKKLATLAGIEIAFTFGKGNTAVCMLSSKEYENDKDPSRNPRRRDSKMSHQRVTRGERDNDFERKIDNESKYEKDIEDWPVKENKRMRMQERNQRFNVNKKYPRQVEVGERGSGPLDTLEKDTEMRITINQSTKSGSERRVMIDNEREMGLSGNVKMKSKREEDERPGRWTIRRPQLREPIILQEDREDASSNPVEIMEVTNCVDERSVLKESDLNLSQPEFPTCETIYLASILNKGFEDEFIEVQELRVAAPTCLPPHEITFVPTIICKDGVYILQPSIKTRLKYGIDFNQGVVDPSTSGLFILNTLDFVVTLYPGTRLGCLHPAEELEDDPTQLLAMADYVKPPFNVDLFNICEEADLKDKQELIKILEEFYDVFSLDNRDLGSTDIVEHSINTGDHAPIRQRLSGRWSEAEHQIIAEQVEEMLKCGVIVRGSSEWSSNIVLAPKPDGSVRFCTDFRQLNSITPTKSHYIPNIQELLDSLNGSKVFHTLDAISGYWQIRMCESDGSDLKTAFVTRTGVYYYKRMGFGLKNAPQEYVELMEKIMGDLKKGVAVYFDDVTPHGTNGQQANANLRVVLERMRSANLKFKIQKCKFLYPEIKLLGFIISGEGVAPDPEKVEAIIKMPVPCTVTKLRAFLGMVNFYRKFADKLAYYVKPLYDLLESGKTSRIWSKDYIAAFEKVKSILAAAPILGHYDSSAPLVLQSDACDYAVAGVLLQHRFRPDKNGKERRFEVPIQFASRSLRKNEKVWSIPEKEALALMFCLQIFRPYLALRPFEIRTDAMSLTYLQNLKDPIKSRIGRWALKLNEFDCSIKHIPGKRNKVADCLSRNPFEKELIPEEALEIPCFVVRIETDAVQKTHPVEWGKLEIKSLSQFQRLDDWCISILESLPLLEEFALVNDVLCKNEQKNGYIIHRVVVPSVIRGKLIEIYHTPKIVGHLGINKTLSRMRERFYWPNMTRQISEYINGCLSCRLHKACHKQAHGAMHPIFPYESLQDIQPGQFLSVDLMGPFKESSRGNKMVILITDYLTRYAIGGAIRDGTAEAVAEFVVNNVVCVYGAFKILLSDNGKCFQSKVLQEMAKILGFHHSFTNPHMPMTNGLVERGNKFLGEMMNVYISKNELTSWDKDIPSFMFAYNTSLQKSTKTTPFFLMFGRDPVLPMDIELNLPSRSLILDSVAGRLPLAFERAGEYLTKAQIHQKQKYDKDKTTEIFEQGDQVLYYVPIRQKGFPDKLQPKCKGPFSFREYIGKTSALIAPLDNLGQADKVSARRLRKFVPYADMQPDRISGGDISRGKICHPVPAAPNEVTSIPSTEIFTNPFPLEELTTDSLASSSNRPQASGSSQQHPLTTSLSSTANAQPRVRQRKKRLSDEQEWVAPGTKRGQGNLDSGGGILRRSKRIQDKHEGRKVMMIWLKCESGGCCCPRCFFLL